MGAISTDHPLSSDEEDDDDLGMDSRFQEFEVAMGLSSPGSTPSPSFTEAVSPLSSTAVDHACDSSSSTFSHVDGHGGSDDVRYLSAVSLSSLDRTESYGGRIGSTDREESGRFVASVMEKVVQMKMDVTAAREEMNDLRQDAGELQEYSNAKLSRVTRYLGVLAERARTLDQVALTSEQRIAPLQLERRKLFNDLLNSKGPIRVFCRVRPQFEQEGATSTTFPNTFTVSVNQGVGGGSFQPAAAKKDFECDHVYGPHVSQTKLFQDIQPLMTSVMDGYNACLLAYGQTNAGKTYTMEGPSHDRGIYYRAFDELFDLANSSIAVSSKFNFSVCVMELHNEQVKDLLLKQQDVGAKTSQKSYEFRQVPGDPGVVITDLTEERIETPVDFAKVLKIANLNRVKDLSGGSDRLKRSHMIVTIHVRSTNLVTNEKRQSKLHLADLAGSERLPRSEASGDRLTESLFVNKSLSALGDCLSALTAKKGVPPFANSKLSLLLSDSIGGEAKTIVIVNCSPGQRDAVETVSSLNFATRARNVELSLGSRDTIKKWRDMANDVRKEFREKERECEERQQEVLAQKKSLQELETQASTLFEELKRSWTMEATLQSEAEMEATRSFNLQAEVDLLQTKLQETESLLREVEEQRGREGEIMVAKHEHEIEKMVEEWETKMVVRQAQQAEALQKLEEKAILERCKAVASYEVRVSQLQQQLAVATSEVEKSAAFLAVSKSNFNKNSENEASDLKKEFEKAKEEIARLKEEVRKSNELTETLNQENERLVSDLMETKVKKETPENMVEKEEVRSEEDWDFEDSKLNPVPHLSKYLLNLPTKSFSSSFDEKPISRMNRIPVQIRASEASDLHLTGRDQKTNRKHSNINNNQSDKKNQSEEGVQMTNLLDTFEFDKFEDPNGIAERANKLLKDVVESVEKRAKGERGSEVELIVELRDAVLSFLGRVQPHVPLDGAIVAQIRILYLRNLLTRMQDLKPGKIPEVHQFLEKDGSMKVSGDKKQNLGSVESGPTFGIFPMKVSLKSEKKLQKFLSFTKSKTDSSEKESINKAKYLELSLESKNFATENEALAYLFAHTDLEEIKKQIRRWLAENFDHLPISGGTELPSLTNSIYEGWLGGIGAIKVKGGRDSLGDLLANYSKKAYESQLQHLMQLSSDLANEEVDDLVTMNRLRTQLESVDLKRSRVMKEMYSDPILTEDERVELPSYKEEEARVASLFILEDVLKSCEEAKKLGPWTSFLIAKKRTQLAKLLSEKVPLMLPIDQIVAEGYLGQAQKHMEVLALTAIDSSNSNQNFFSSTNSSSALNLNLNLNTNSNVLSKSQSLSSPVSQKNVSTNNRELFSEESVPGIPDCLRGELIEWSAVQFNSRAGTPPIMVKCGATSRLELVAKVVIGKGGKEGGGGGGGSQQSFEICMMPLPVVLENLNSVEEIVKELKLLPDSLKTLILAKTVPSIRERYSRLYKTLSARIPVLKKVMGSELDDYLPGQKKNWTAPSPDRLLPDPKISATGNSVDSRIYPRSVTSPSGRNSGEREREGRALFPGALSTP